MSLPTSYTVSLLVTEYTCTLADVSFPVQLLGLSRADLSNALPAALGAAAAGSDTSASRADHVHPTTGLEPAAGNPSVTGDCLVSTTAGVRSWATRLTQGAADLLYAPLAHASRHNAGGADALAIDAAAATGSLRTLGTAATAAAAGNHNHSGVYTPVGTDIPLSTVTTAGDRIRATGNAAVARIACAAALGNLTGAITPALTPDALHSCTLTGNITSWGPTGLESGEGATIKIGNASGYSVATTGLTAAWTDALADIATDGAWLVLWNSGGTYYGAAQA